MTPAFETAHELGKFQLFRSHLTPELAAEFDALAGGLPLVDPEPDDDDASPLDEPGMRAAFSSHMRTGHRAFNAHEVDALMEATGENRVFCMFVSMFLYRLKGLPDVTRTMQSWAVEFGIPLRKMRAIVEVAEAKRFVRCKTGRNNVTTFILDAAALEAFNFDYARSIEVDLAGLAGWFEQNAQTVERKRKQFHGLSEMLGHCEQNAQTRIQGKETLKPPASPADTAAQQDGPREPGEDDEETPSQPPASASRSVEQDTATDVLERACTAKGIPHTPGEIAAFVKLRDVTPTEAAHAAGVVRNATDPIDRFNYVKSVIENYRANGKKRDQTTPVGGHADPAITRRVLADLDSARKHPPAADEQARHMEEMRAVLRPHSKALTKS